MTFFMVMKPEIAGVMQIRGSIEVDSSGNKYKSVVLNKRNENTRLVLSVIVGVLR